MITKDSGAGVKANLTALKKAVDAVAKANKHWLLALQGFLEGRDPKTTDPTKQAENQSIALVIARALPGLSNVNGNVPGNMPVDQALRLALDEVALLQLADRKLEGKVSPLEPTSENLGRAIVESEAYLVVTDEAFTSLFTISGTNAFASLDAKLRTAANDARKGNGKNVTGLAPQLATLLKSAGPGQTGGIILPSPGPDGTELLLGKSLGRCAQEFLAQMPLGAQETIQTQQLLSNGRFTLLDNQINVLINSWGKAVKQATDNLTNSPSFTLADLFCIHTTLETLYDRLETNVTRGDVDILSLEI